MKQDYIRTTPSAQVVATADMKESLGVESTFTGHDTMIARQITSATYEVEGFLWMTLLTTSWTLTQGNLEDEIPLRHGPVTSITSVKYYDSANTQQTMSSGDYFLTSGLHDAKVVFLGTLPTLYDRPDAIEIVFVAGVTSIVDTRPVEYIYWRVADMYDNPMDETEKYGMTTRAKSYLRAIRKNAF